MALHLTFNHVIHFDAGTLTLVLAVLLGLGGVVLVVGFIFWGLRDGKRWLPIVTVYVGQANVPKAVGVGGGVWEAISDADTLAADVPRMYAMVQAK